MQGLIFKSEDIWLIMGAPWREMILLLIIITRIPTMLILNPMITRQKMVKARRSRRHVDSIR